MTISTLRGPACGAAFVTFLVSACGGGGAELQPRFVAVHNAMSASGLAQTGSISQGSLPEGADARVDVELEAGVCYTFVALGSDGISNVDVRVLDDQDEERARDNTHDGQAAAQLCPDTAGTFHVVVRAAEGSGEYMVSSWSGSGHGGGLASHDQNPPAGRGSCSEPLELTLGTPVQGNTREAGTSRLAGSCAQGEAPEQVYQFQITERVQVSASIQSDYDGALYILSSCGPGAAEIACNDDDSGNTQRSRIETTLEPGTYFLVVDGYDSNAGTYELIVSAAPLQPIAQVCSGATPLAAGQPQSGTTVGSANYFQATCAGGAASPDRVYSLDLTQRSRVRLHQQSDHDGAVYMRRTCDDANTELVCDDDFEDQQHSLVTTVVDAGRYFVYTDGFGQGAAGNYTIQADVVNDPPNGVDGDACAAPRVLAPGTQATFDTFEARDDATGSCGGGGAADIVYRLELRNRSRISAVLTHSQFGGVMYLRTGCADAATEQRCVPFPRQGQGRLDATLNRGTYFLIVDGEAPGAFGTGALDVTVQDAAALDRACRSAPLLVSGATVRGDTTTGSDNFQASCAGNALSNDVLYRVQLRRRSLVRLSLESDHDGALHMRRDCLDQATELACNDDHEDNRHALIEQTLDAGTYFVVVDGFHTGSVGPYSLTTQITPQ